MEEDDEEAKHSDEEEGATGGGPPGSDERKDDSEEEEKGDKKKSYGGLGFVDNDEDEDKDSEFADDDEEEEVDEAFDLNVTMDMLNAPFKKTDEFGYFNTQFRALYDRDMTYINNLVAQMNEEEKKFLHELMETKRVKIAHKGVEKDVVRRIITVKRRGGVGSGAPNNALN